MSLTIECPHCNTKDCYDEPWRLDEGEHEVECSECNRIFIVSVDTVFDYTSEKKDCEEGACKFGKWRRSDYDWEWIKRHPRDGDKPYSLWIKRCVDCDNCEIEQVEFQADLPVHLKEGV